MFGWIVSGVVVFLLLAFLFSKAYRDAIRDEHRTDRPQLP